MAATALLASRMVGALPVHIFVIGIAAQTIAGSCTVVGNFAVSWHHRAR